MTESASRQLRDCKTTRSDEGRERKGDLVPTPPVECLSTVGSGKSEKSILPPDSIIASVHRPVSARDIPRK
ncbi:hypothetical protein GCM10020255_068220 [Rhodococcus baikonurensis]